jgi:hypothetical protein
MRETLAALAACALFAGGAARAEPAAAPTSPERLEAAPYPANPPWKKITDQANGQMRLVEWIPADQTEDAITDILTQQTLFPLKDYDPSAFVAGMMRDSAARCSGARVNGPKAAVENGFRVAYAQIYCVGDRVSHIDAELFIKAISGHDALYLVHREFHRPAVPGRVAGVMSFPAGEEAKGMAMLEAQKTANGYLVSSVRLCAAGPAGSCAPGVAQAPPPASAAATPPDESFPPFVNGTSTAKEVRDKLGKPASENHNPDGRFVYLYQAKNGAILTFLFDAQGVLTRVRGYARQP